MRIKTLQENELPNLSNDVKNYLKKGFWSLIEAQDTKGKQKLFIKAKDEIFELTEKGNVKNIFKLESFQPIITAKVNLSL